MKIKNIPVGFDIHDLELQLGKGSEAIRSAGSSGKVSSLDGDKAQVNNARQVKFVMFLKIVTQPLVL